MDLEIVQLAMLCKVKLLSSGVMEQVLDNNATVAGNDNPRAFTKLRGLLFLHFEIEQRLTGCCATAAHAKALVRLVQDSLARRLGDKVNVLR
ncbi:hypothetical protein [Roseateles sp. YR242]|uniref:hypothetical protein n=1 Tax=Roseateles sp. YR242 TaxID=1855305 RepID=UPI001C432B9C|nr:hypothetical protein [Roseateles sp. YR242]